MKYLLPPLLPSMNVAFLLFSFFFFLFSFSFCGAHHKRLRCQILLGFESCVELCKTYRDSLVHLLEWYFISLTLLLLIIHDIIFLLPFSLPGDGLLSKAWMVGHGISCGKGYLMWLLPSLVIFTHCSISIFFPLI
jgi:hypothetical protein